MHCGAPLTVGPRRPGCSPSPLPCISLPMTKTKDPEQTTLATPSPENGATKKGLKPVELRTAHDFELMRRSAINEADALDKVSEKLKTAGYAREAATIAADAAAIRSVILPQLSAQQELPLVSAESLDRQIVEAIKLEIFQMFDGIGDSEAKLMPSVVTARRDRLVRVLASRVTAFAQELGEAARLAGYQARSLTSEVLAARVVPVLAGNSGTRAD